MFWGILRHSLASALVFLMAFTFVNSQAQACGKKSHKITKKAAHRSTKLASFNKKKISKKSKIAKRTKKHSRSVASLPKKTKLIDPWEVQRVELPPPEPYHAKSNSNQKTKSGYQDYYNEVPENIDVE